MIKTPEGRNMTILPPNLKVFQRTSENKLKKIKLKCVDLHFSGASEGGADPHRTPFLAGSLATGETEGFLRTPETT